MGKKKSKEIQDILEEADSNNKPRIILATSSSIGERIGYEPKEGEYIIITNAVIMNSKNEILISKRAPHKTYPLMWEFNGGAVLAGENSQEAILLKTIRRDILPQDFKDVWLFKKDIKIEDITFPDGESIDQQHMDKRTFQKRDR